MISPAGASSLREALRRTCPPLAALDLKDNALGNGGAASIASGGFSSGSLSAEALYLVARNSQLATSSLAARNV